MFKTDETLIPRLKEIELIEDPKTQFNALVALFFTPPVTYNPFTIQIKELNLLAEIRAASDPTKYHNDIPDDEALMMIHEMAQRYTDAIRYSIIITKPDNKNWISDHVQLIAEENKTDLMDDTNSGPVTFKINDEEFKFIFYCEEGFADPHRCTDKTEMLEYIRTINTRDIAIDGENGFYEDRHLLAGWYGKLGESFIEYIDPIADTCSSMSSLRLNLPPMVAVMSEELRGDIDILKAMYDYQDDATVIRALRDFVRVNNNELYKKIGLNKENLDRSKLEEWVNEQYGTKLNLDTRSKDKLVQSKKPVFDPKVKVNVPIEELVSELRKMDADRNEDNQTEHFEKIVELFLTPPVYFNRLTHSVDTIELLGQILTNEDSDWPYIESIPSFEALRLLRTIMCRALERFDYDIAEFTLGLPTWNHIDKPIGKKWADDKILMIPEEQAAGLDPSKCTEGTIQVVFARFKRIFYCENGFITPRRCTDKNEMLEFIANINDGIISCGEGAGYYPDLSRLSEIYGPIADRLLQYVDAEADVDHYYDIDYLRGQPIILAMSDELKGDIDILKAMYEYQSNAHVYDALLNFMKIHNPELIKPSKEECYSYYCDDWESKSEKWINETYGTNFDLRNREWHCDDVDVDSTYSPEQEYANVDLDFDDDE